MNSITFYVGYILAVVMFRVSNAAYEVFSDNKETPFNFRYKWNDFLLMKITLNNIPPSVTAVYAIYSVKANFYQNDPDLFAVRPMREKVQTQIKNGTVYYGIQKRLIPNSTLFDVELQTRDGLCRKSRLAEGRWGSPTSYYHNGYKYIYWYTDWKYDDTNSCVVPKSCEIVMDFKYKCQENFNCNVKTNVYICTFQTGNLENHKSYLYQAYDTDEPRTNATFREDYTYLEAVDSFYKIHNKTRSWYEAKRVCDQEGASLFYPENSVEAEAVISFWNPTSKDLMWVGISDVTTDGVFVTVDGRSISEVYNNWISYQPDNYEDQEDCVYLDKNREYNDIPCDVDWCSFICKKSLLQNIRPNLSSAIGAPLNTSAMNTKLIFELELFDNNTSVLVASPTSKKLHRSDKIVLTAEDVVQEHFVKTQMYNETTEVQFSCKDNGTRSKYSFIAVINTINMKTQTLIETKEFRRKFKMADNGSILCCLYYFYESFNDGKALQIERIVINKTLLIYQPEVPIAPDPANEGNNTVAIVSSLSCLAVILVFITIVIWKRHLIKCNQSGTLQQINEPSNPFYLNMLFRRECDREIADIERHEYEEIEEHLYDEIQNQYENIHPEEFVAYRVASTSSSDTLPIPEAQPSATNICRHLLRSSTAQQNS